VTATAVEAVTENGSAQVGATVFCNACEVEKGKRPYRWGKRLDRWDTPHCLACHGDGHRECEVCGKCMRPADRVFEGDFRGRYTVPIRLRGKPARLDRIYCSSTCRGRAHKQRERQRLERQLWEAEHPDEAAKEKAEYQAWLAGLKQIANATVSPGEREHEQRRRTFQGRAERCAGIDWDAETKTVHDCEHVFAAGDVIYRRREGGPLVVEDPVLPYCAEHRCAQSDGSHNRDAPEGRHYANCSCDDSHWTTPGPCLGCGRLVAHPRNARWRRRSRDWEHHGDPGLPAVPRVFCSTDCKRRVLSVEARGRRLAAAAERGKLRCVVCEREFEATRHDARYCSSGCRQRAYRKRKAAA